MFGVTALDRDTMLVNRPYNISIIIILISRDWIMYIRSNLIQSNFQRVHAIAQVCRRNSLSILYKAHLPCHQTLFDSQSITTHTATQYADNVAFGFAEYA